ncbi:MAG: tetratricopeptide repeat protein [Puniceicoccaceae bacterium]|nr:tetratricopeptide repeat protein [Puniceicoccaceae bacterium]MBL6838608.1 tetratricopeptide repeat protein [Puniceicoccaceae bacterium]
MITPNSIRLFAVFIASFFLSSSSYAQENISTLQEVLARGQAALAAGDYTTAFKAFETIQTTFSREPEVSERVFQITIMPLHGYAALLSEETDKAIQLFEKFVDEFPEDRSRLSFVLFNLARAYSEISAVDKAINTYKRFIALDPNRAEAALATLEAVRLMFETGRDDEAFTTLDNVYANQREGVLRTKARLMALQQALDLSRNDQAREYMLNSDWSVDQMPELAVLAFAALEMGHQLLASGDYVDAVECYRLVPPYAQLINAQERRLYETKTRFESRRQSVGLYQGGQFWTQFYTRLIARLEAQLKGLREADDYSAALYLAFGQAYLLAERPREAWILFEHLARDPELSKQQQSEAHYRWILAAIQVGVWEDAYRIAKGFGRRFPDSPLVPNALYLLGTAYQEAGEYPDAIKVFTTFLENHDQHDLAPRTLFLRGFNHNFMNQPVEARADFESFIARYPRHQLSNEARLWRALSFFAERDYTTALEALKVLAPKVKGGRLEPEVAYRIASTHYAMRDYDSAHSSINGYLNSYPQHTRADEARVLLGDIEMGRGELATARAIFMEISPNAGHLFVYSAFQAGKILRAVAGAAENTVARERMLSSHIEHFQNYLNREDVPLKGRISEALYWVGWTHAERGETDLARLVFERALIEYGNDIESEDVPTIIDAYAQLEKRLNTLGSSERKAQLKAWIEAEKAKALETERLTYFARLSLYLQSMVPPDHPTNLTFEIIEKVPMEQLDPEALGRIATTLVKPYPRVAEDYLIRLEDEYPDSRHRSYAYYARAQLLIQKADFEDARWHLARFRTESPLHHLATDVALDYAHTLTMTEKFDEAQTVLEELLTLRSAKGRPHATALLALSRNAEAAGNVKRAIPYAQRVYNVYRAYPDLAAQAYWMSALQFESIEDLVAAYKTLDEMLSSERIAKLPIAKEAAVKREALFELLPEGALEEASTETAEVSQEVAL